MRCTDFPPSGYRHCSVAMMTSESFPDALSTTRQATPFISGNPLRPSSVRKADSSVSATLATTSGLSCSVDFFGRLASISCASRRKFLHATTAWMSLDRYASSIRRRAASGVGAGQVAAAASRKASIDETYLMAASDTRRHGRCRAAEAAAALFEGGVLDAARTVHARCDRHPLA